MTTRWPGSMASRWISSESVPYSELVADLGGGGGSLRGLRTGTKPALRR